MSDNAALKEAIVLCGGFGTRLQKVVSDLPKPMAPVAGRPFLEHVMDYLHNHKVQHAVLAVGYLRESIMEHFKDRYKDIRISYSIEEELLGTGGGIKQACDMLEGDTAIVLNGDTFFDVDMDALMHFHAEKKATLSVALKEMHNFDRYGTVDIDAHGKIIRFHEKKYMDAGLINGGVYYLNRSVFSHITSSKFSFEKEILEKEYQEGKVFGKIFNGYFIDIGIPEDYEKAQHDMTGE